MNFSKLSSMIGLNVLLFAPLMTQAAETKSLTIYSSRQPFLIEPILEDFKKQTGTEVKLNHISSGMAEKAAQEGKYSEADVFLTVDISRLVELKNKGLTQSLSNEQLEETIPQALRDPENHWFGLTMRSRIVYSSRDRVGVLPKDFTIADLADPKYKGKICSRSGKSAYNVSLITAMMVHEGGEGAKKWLTGLKNNLARKPQGNDRAQVKAIKEGLCDYAIGNSYYLGKMLTNAEQLPWAQSVVLNLVPIADGKHHVNISGMALAKHTKQKELATELMEYLVSEQAQELYAQLNFEYPVRPKTDLSPLVAYWGELKPDDLPLQTIADNHTKALKLVDTVKFDF